MLSNCPETDVLWVSSILSEYSAQTLNCSQYCFAYHCVPISNILLLVPFTPFSFPLQGHIYCLIPDSISKISRDSSGAVGWWICPSEAFDWFRWMLFVMCLQPWLGRQCLQVGHEEWERSHLSIHPMWKPWLQLGNTLISSPSTNSPKQIAQPVVIHNPGRCPIDFP